MIKVPATPEGLPAIRQLISEGVNVNITLLFGLARYQEVVEAYLAGLEDCRQEGGPLEKTASVASFFLSRIDSLIDKELDMIAKGGQLEGSLARSLRGKIAIASAKMAYRLYKKSFSSDRFRRLAAEGARTQKLLWASTSAKDPAYSDVMYVDALIGPDTVNTLPMKTLQAYRDHGRPEPRLERNVEETIWQLSQLEVLGIDLPHVTEELVVQGVRKFAEPFRDLLSALEQKRQAA
jgi:transaldolase